jgi:hypothetical protein
MYPNPKATECTIIAPTRRRLLWPTAFSCVVVGLSIGGGFAKGAELTFDCKGAEPNTSLTMKFADGKLTVKDPVGSSDFQANLDGDLEQTFSISGAVTREMIMPDLAALETCISARLAKISKTVSDKNAFGGSRQMCFAQLFPSGTKQTVDVTYSVVGTEPGTADLLIHSQFKTPSKLNGEILYVNQMPDQSCSTKLAK